MINKTFFEGVDFSNPKQIEKYLLENQDTLLSIRAEGVQIIRNGECIFIITDKSCIEAAQKTANIVAKKQKGIIPLPNKIDPRELNQIRNESSIKTSLFALSDVALMSYSVYNFTQFAKTNQPLDEISGGMCTVLGGVALGFAVYNWLKSESVENDEKFLASLKNNPIEKQ